jgi:hypothetical protein
MGTNPNSGKNPNYTPETQRPGLLCDVRRVTCPIVPGFSAADTGRALRALDKLGRHDTGVWALTGGLAFEIQGMRLGLEASMRTLNDLDFVAGSFSSVPETLARDFLFRHIHPLAPPGKTMAQLVDPENALRIDVFRACGETMNRTVSVGLPCGPMRVVSIEDLIARAARLLLDLDQGLPVAAKHAGQYARFVDLADPEKMEAAWQDHKKPEHPAIFQEAKAKLDALIPSARALLIDPEYSRDTRAQCPLCVPTSAFPLADARVVLSLLGYC